MYETIAELVKIDNAYKSMISGIEEQKAILKKHYQDNYQLDLQNLKNSYDIELSKRKQAQKEDWHEFNQVQEKQFNDEMAFFEENFKNKKEEIVSFLFQKIITE